MFIYSLKSPLRYLLTGQAKYDTLSLYTTLQSLTGSRCHVTVAKLKINLSSLSPLFFKYLALPQPSTSRNNFKLSLVATLSCVHQSYFTMSDTEQVAAPVAEEVPATEEVAETEAPAAEEEAAAEESAEEAS